MGAEGGVEGAGVGVDAKGWREEEDGKFQYFTIVSKLFQSFKNIMCSIKASPSKLAKTGLHALFELQFFCYKYFLNSYMQSVCEAAQFLIELTI